MVTRFLERIASASFSSISPYLLRPLRSYAEATEDRRISDATKERNQLRNKARIHAEVRASHEREFSHK